MSQVVPSWLSRRWSAAIVPRLRSEHAGWLQGMWVVADQAVVSLASFFALVVVGRNCSPSDLGIYGLAVYTFWLAAGIPNALVWVPYTARVPRMAGQRRQLFAGSATIHAAIVALVLAGATLLIGAVAHFTRSDNAWILPLCLALAPFIILMTAREHARRLNLADLQVHELLRIDVPFAVIQMALLVGLAQFGMLTATTALLAIALACVNTFTWYFRNRDQFAFDADRALVHWGYNQQFGRWIFVVAIAWLVSESSGRWMVGMFYGSAVLGQFVAAQGIVMAINPLLLTINNLAQAKSSHGLARGGPDELRSMAVRGTLLIAVGTGAALVCLAAIGGPAVHFFFPGEKYAALGHVVTTLCLGMFARMLLMPIEAAMVALQRGRTMLVASIVRLVMIIGTGAPLIWWCGLDGVGYALTISSAGAGIVQWYDFLKLSQASAAGEFA
jgi:O-antigen/teichoic acid export membrane protein